MRAGHGAVRSTDAATRVLVVRVWTEPGVPELRGRLVEARGLEDAQTKAAAGVDGICDAVRTWLESIAAFEGVTPA